MFFDFIHDSRQGFPNGREVAPRQFRDFLVGITFAVKHDERLFLLVEMRNRVEDVGRLVKRLLICFGQWAFHRDGPCRFPFVVDSFVDGTPDEPVFLQ